MKPLRLMGTRRSCALGVDVGVQRTSILAADDQGRPLLDLHQFATPPGPQGLVEDLTRGIDHVLARLPKVECRGVGVVVPGLVDLGRGRLLFSPTLGWRNVDLRGPLQAATRLPVVVENSPKACVLAQVRTVGREAATDGPAVFVNVSEGVGVGVVANGRLLRGAHNNAGEFGHIPLDMDGPRCACGQAVAGKPTSRFGPPSRATSAPTRPGRRRVLYATSPSRRSSLALEEAKREPGAPFERRAGTSAGGSRRS